MNVETGRILFKDDLEKAMESMSEIEKRKFLQQHKEIDGGCLTDKQKKEKQVSKFDNRSKLGKNWTQIRKERTAKKKLVKKSRAKNRRK